VVVHFSGHGHNGLPIPSDGTGGWLLGATANQAFGCVAAGRWERTRCRAQFVVRRAGHMHMHRTHRTVVRSPAADLCACFLCFHVRAEGMPTSCFLVPLGMALETRTGGGGTAVVCLLLDCCNSGRQLVFSDLETVFVGCVMCDLMPDACSTSKPSSHDYSLASALIPPGLSVVLRVSAWQAAVRGGRGRRAGAVGVLRW
jgi:hypothetical protein